ncbi:auxin-responsive protein IAA10-like isoform X2 [Zingiber officinale]|uniref:auxin-responsive protein IAA10-like isoform X2 n=1 Tax=Zingiber officinale TaxID=94328 RepID=UPI001C4C86E9|nr:auxin-responsive protein IAA10-like isoform X2 [Zingiber officinale]XP_042393423.1 auxin-responsive protein IAA10-like isoform X2 [Zingiber officinale]
MEGDRRYDGGAASPASVSSVSKAAERDVEVEDEVAAGVAEGEEAESDRDDEGLELGLTLGAAGKWNPPPVPWSPCLRILTAKDLPSLASLAPPRSPSASSVSSSSVTNLRGGGTGTKRSDEPASPDFGGSPQPPSQMVVGWPPIRAFRMNSLFNQSKEHTPETAAVAIKKSVSKDQNRKDQGGRRTEMRSSMFVKVKMDGDPIGRKVDLNAHHSYEALAVSLELMFQKPTMATNLLASFVDSDGAMSLKSLDSSSEFALTYEDKDGDWMLVGDVPWGMFVETAKRLRIMKISDATGLSI